MQPTPDQARRIESLIRSGTIAEIDHANARVRVESGGLMTDWLPWHTGRAGGVKQWSPPSVGEQVLMLSPSGETGAAVVMTGIYSDAQGSPSQSDDEIVTQYPDGAVILYNHKTGALQASGVKSASLSSADSLTIDCPSVHITGTLTVDEDVIADGVSLHNHVHGQTQPGSGQTGVPAS